MRCLLKKQNTVAEFLFRELKIT